jgi:hypothetical protein
LQPPPMALPPFASTAGAGWPLLAAEVIRRTG